MHSYVRRVLTVGALGAVVVSLVDSSTSPTTARAAPASGPTRVLVENPELAVRVNNFPGVQNVTGTVQVGNLPAVQQIDGTVTVRPAPAPVTEWGSGIAQRTSTTFQSVELPEGLVLTDLHLSRVDEGTSLCRVTLSESIDHGSGIRQVTTVRLNDARPVESLRFETGISAHPNFNNAVQFLVTTDGSDCTVRVVWSGRLE